MFTEQTIKLCKVSRLIVLLFVWISPALYAQQFPQYAQYMFNPLAINPAVAGGEEALSIGFINRDQWKGIENAPSTQTLNAHSLFLKQNLGLGLVFTHDKIGVHKNLFASVAPAYHLKISKHSTLSFGAQVNVVHQRSDYPTLIQSGPTDPNLTRAVNTVYTDFGFGLYFRTANFQLGLSAPSFRKQQVNPSDTVSLHYQHANYFLFTRYQLPINPYWKIEPGFLAKHSHNLPFAWDANINFIYRNVLTFGASYRSEKSVTALLMAHASRQLRIGYTYDFSVGNTWLPRSGSHELMVKYVFKFLSKPNHSPR